MMAPSTPEKKYFMWIHRKLLTYKHKILQCNTCFLTEKNDVEKNINSLGFAFQMYQVIMFETQFKTF